MTPPICTSIARIPARTENTVRPLEERLVKSPSHGFDAVPGTKFDRTGLVKVRIIPAIMARALEYLLSMFTNAKDASPRLCLNSPAKRVQIPSRSRCGGFRSDPLDPKQHRRVVFQDLLNTDSQTSNVKTLELVECAQFFLGPAKD